MRVMLAGKRIAADEVSKGHPEWWYPLHLPTDKGVAMLFESWILYHYQCLLPSGIPE